MLSEEFAEAKSGRLVELAAGNVAFLPDRLPPSLEIGVDLLKAAERARGALGEFVGESRLVENQTLIAEPLAIREAVLSNKIEGTHTTVAGVLLQRAGSPPADSTQRNNQQEVLNYFRALELGGERMAEWPLGLTLVRALHEVLLQPPTDVPCRTGRFRATQAYIGRRYDDESIALRRARYVPPPPEHVPAAMDDWGRALVGEPSYGVLIDCAILHYQFEAIHPFEDGNGRMGRLLIPLYLLANRVLDRPILYLSWYFESHLDRYVDLMKRVSTQGAWADWILFFLEAVEVTAQESRRRVRAVLAIRDRYHERVRAATRTQAALAAVDLILSRVVVTANDLAQHAKCSYPTARKALAALAAMGIVSPVEGRRNPQAWMAEELLSEVYSLTGTAG